MGGITVGRYLGEVFDSNETAIVPLNEEHLPALWCYASSIDFRDALWSIEQSVKVNNGKVAELGSVSFKLHQRNSLRVFRSHFRMIQLSGCSTAIQKVPIPLCISQQHG